MQLKTKTLIHYIINTIVLLITIGVLVIVFAYKSTSELIDEIGISIGITAVTTLISSLILTLVFANDHTKPLRIILPLFLTIIVYSLMTGIIISIYDKFFYAYDYHNSFSNNPWGSIGMMIVALTFIALFMLMNIYSSRFLLISVSGSRAAEWEINNFESLLYNKAFVSHNKNYSYIFSKNKLLVTRFITEDQIERKLVFESDEISKKSDIITNIESEVKRIRGKIDIPVFGSITYLSNKLPELQGSRTKGFILTKNSNLFTNFRKIPKNKETEISKIKEAIK